MYSSLCTHGEANSFSLNLWRSCSSRTVISPMGRCFGLGDGLKPGRMGFLRLTGETGEVCMVFGTLSKYLRIKWYRKRGDYLNLDLDWLNWDQFLTKYPFWIRTSLAVTRPSMSEIYSMYVLETQYQERTCRKETCIKYKYFYQFT
jgi:hypothetical protein